MTSNAAKSKSFFVGNYNIDYKELNPTLFIYIESRRSFSVTFYLFFNLYLICFMFFYIYIFFGQLLFFFSIPRTDFMKGTGFSVIKLQYY